ncbi:MAG: thioredoxin [Weeksellaceae bacterium]|jgi:thioredoxin 1|nr:thioredoxin [Weeksellaceae bacterium]
MKFNEIILQDKPVLVDLYADWCAPCRIQTPILQELKQKMGEQLSIIKVDVDKNPQLAARLQVRSIPTLMIFRKGEIKWKHSGVVQADELERIIQQNS